MCTCELVIMFFYYTNIKVPNQYEYGTYGIYLKARGFNLCCGTARIRIEEQGNWPKLANNLYSSFLKKALYLCS